MSSKKRAWIIGVFIFLFAGPAAAYYAFREDPQVAKYRDARAKTRDKELTQEDRRKYEQEANAAWDQMGPEKQISYQRHRFDNERMQKGIEQYNKEMDDFMALDPKERRKKVQEQVKAEEKRAKDRAAEQAKRDADNAKAQAAGGTGGTGGSSQAQNGQAGQGGRGGGGGGGGRGPGRGSPQQQRLALDFGSPDGRAKRAEYSREKQLARVQMNLPPDTPRGGGRGGFGGGGGGRGPR
jgi:hypothetical protein